MRNRSSSWYSTVRFIADDLRGGHHAGTDQLLAQKNDDIYLNYRDECHDRTCSSLGRQDCIGADLGGFNIPQTPMRERSRYLPKRALPL